MILLYKDINNSAIMTLTEFENGYVGEYYINIKNNQDNSEYNEIYICDISTNPYRFNEFNIVVTDDENESGYTYDDETKTTTIYNLLSGYYDYVATDLDSNVLEKGRLRVSTEDDVVVDGYSATCSVYNGTYIPEIIVYKK